MQVLEFSLYVKTLEMMLKDVELQISQVKKDVNGSRSVSWIVWDLFEKSSI